jgi:hypothetical protein
MARYMYLGILEGSAVSLPEHVLGYLFALYRQIS